MMGFWRILGLILAALVLVADLASKDWLLDYVRQSGGYIHVTGFFNLVEVWNRGVSFGMFQSDGVGRWILVVLSGAITIAMAVWFWRAVQPRVLTAIGLIVGGAVGNLVDRIWLGAVRDFFDFHVAGYHWPAFNVADAAIVLGVGLLLLDAFLPQKPANTADSARSP